MITFVQWHHVMSLGKQAMDISIDDIRFVVKLFLFIENQFLEFFKKKVFTSKFDGVRRIVSRVLSVHHPRWFLTEIAEIFKLKSPESATFPAH